MLEYYFIGNVNYYLDKISVLGLDILNDYILLLNTLRKSIKFADEETKKKLELKLEEVKKNCSLYCNTF